MAERARRSLMRRRSLQAGVLGLAVLVLAVVLAREYSRQLGWPLAQ